MDHYINILFDLDGTLVDSGEGIIKCAQLALRHFSLPMPTPTEMRTFVGPPLKDSFVRFGVAPEKAQEAVDVYRSRYTTVGKFEGFPYPGVPELLEKLHKDGYHLFVATSKPEDMAVEILEHFGMAPYFDCIAGATLDGSRSSKSSVIASLLERAGGVDGALMVGDTAFDVEGALAHHIPTVGVDWGYGLREDMASAGAVAIVDTAEELEQFIRGEK